MSSEEGADLKALANRVDAEPHLQWVWRAFRNLNGDRQIGIDGAGPIFWSSIDAYARRYRIKGDRFERLVDLIRAMDDEWLTARESWASE